MATAALPAATPSRRVRVRAIAGIVGNTLTTAAGHLLTPHKAALRNLAHMPLTVIGAGLIDFAAFHYVHMIGWLITGVSLVVVEHLIADEP